MRQSENVFPHSFTQFDWGIYKSAGQNMSAYAAAF